jgi:hypothetical protein
MKSKALLDATLLLMNGINWPKGIKNLTQENKHYIFHLTKKETLLHKQLITAFEWTKTLQTTYLIGSVNAPRR